MRIGEWKMQIEDINENMNEQPNEQVDESITEDVSPFEQFEDNLSDEFNKDPEIPVAPIEKDNTINAKLNNHFAGKIVRKDLTKKIKEGANVPVYVLEYLLGMYCATTDEASIEQGVVTVKKILADNFVRPDEAQKIISKLREQGSYTVIDKISVKLNYKNDTYEAEFSNLGIKNVPVSEKYASEFERLLCGGIWCIVGLEYFFDEADKNRCPFLVKKLTPIQMPNLDLSEVLTGREQFTKDEWIDILLRSVGMESSRFSNRVKWLLLARMIPLVENNFNLCELGPRGTGKSHVYKEISPNSILVSGGQTTVANLFYNMSNKTVGLVGMWDCVAFDEVAGITFKDKDGVQIMKDYMASGSFARGKEEKNASAGMVFVGNINQSVDVLLKTSHLFDPFPEAMANDSAFFDRMHCYIPGWEVPKYRPEFFTDDYGFITDYLSEFLRELRKKSYGDSFDQYFKLGNNLNQRDVIAVRKMVSGLVKLIYPHGKFSKEDVEEILRFALESRRRVKEQLKKIGGMEFYDVNFSYIDNESFAEEFVPVPEQGGGKLIPEGLHKPGQVYTVSYGKSGMIGVFKLETETVTGSGKFERTGVGSDREAKESLDTSFRYFKANSKNISGSISTTTKDYLMHIQDLNGIGMTSQLTLAALVALSSSAMNKPALGSLAVLGNLSIGGTIIKVQELANVLQVCLDSGAKKVLLPISSAVDMASVPAELMGKFNLIFYQSPEDAVFKALGVD
jgi:ATP-dependent Lon protease